MKKIGGSLSLWELMPGSHSRTGYREAPLATRSIDFYHNNDANVKSLEFLSLDTFPQSSELS